MKKLNKIYAMMALSAAFTLTGCIEETEPEGGFATEDQVLSSPSALDGAINGISSQMSQGYLVYGEQVTEIDMGLPALMITQTELLGDIYPGEPDNVGYDWYRRYNICGGVGPTTDFSYIPWFTLYKFVKSANDVIGLVNLEDPATTDEQRGYAGIAYACRAYEYYLLTVLYEPVENIYTDVSRVKGLTVPFVLETTTGDDAKNNPRVKHDEMIAFILSDLDKAEQCLQNFSPKNRLAPNLACVYAIKAKVYLLDSDYANAAKYARMAINESGATPMSESELEDPTTAFAKATSAWMWYLHYDAENMGNLCNYTGWVSGEADWSYSSLYRPSIDRSLYDHISANDYRKHWFLDPKKTDYYNYKTVRDADFIEEAPDYLALKFRCLNGDWETYSIGGVSDVPVIRVEEMYLIEAEAVGASQGVAAGVSLLNTFMQNYRDPSYNYTGSDLRQFQLEVLTQMRIESWGEGWAFPSAKRLQPDVIQNYEGTNAPDNTFKINCKGIKPTWTLVIPNTEVQSNIALDGYNNPDPSQAVEGPTPIGEFAPAK
ncbi:MAG: RagB/SusD family nutrient uptake outer membrane protein [Prevotella sp.]|nr:RagB/SusD family nutrient uptake outer membrane protein [Prevotella sp.]